MGTKQHEGMTSDDVLEHPVVGSVATNVRVPPVIDQLAS